MARTRAFHAGVVFRASIAIVTRSPCRRDRRASRLRHAGVRRTTVAIVAAAQVAFAQACVTHVLLGARISVIAGFTRGRGVNTTQARITRVVGTRIIIVTQPWRRAVERWPRGSVAARIVRESWLGADAVHQRVHRGIGRQQIVVQVDQHVVDCMHPHRIPVRAADVRVGANGIDLRNLADIASRTVRTDARRQVRALGEAV